MAIIYTLYPGAEDFGEALAKANGWNGKFWVSVEGFCTAQAAWIADKPNMKLSSPDKRGLFLNGKFETVSVPLVIETRHIGCVAGTRERNWSDDSDFYATVYDPETSTIREVEYATTRFAGGGWATVDITDENRAKAEAVNYDTLYKRHLDWQKSNYTAPKLEKGCLVKFNKDYKPRQGTYKGRTIPKGSGGTVFWVGEPKYNQGIRVGLVIAGDEEILSYEERGVFVSAYVLDVIQPVEFQYDYESAKEYAERHMKDLGYTSKLDSAMLGMYVI